MNRIADVLARKGGQIHAIESTATVFDAVKKMVEHNLGSVLVQDGTTIRGIFTERDYLRQIVLKGRTSRTTLVHEVMTSRLICVDPSQDVEECLALMTQERIRHLPVMERDRLVGIVSIGDLVKFLSRERQVELRYLTDYISGKYPG